jgi:Flp pilus assembly protein TadG
MKSRLSSAAGQGLVEVALVLPLFVLLALGVIEAGNAILEQHVVTKLTREGSNLISRDVTLHDAANAMRAMQTQPVNFSTNSRMILSVVRRGATVGTPNYNKDILYSRHQIGPLAKNSKLTTRGAGSFGAAPEYTARNADTDTNLQITNLPANVVLSTGGMVYVTEIYTSYSPLTPFEGLGFDLPDAFYSIAYF